MTKIVDPSSATSLNRVMNYMDYNYMNYNSWYPICTYNKQ